MTEAYFQKLKSAVLGHCIYGTANACSGDPLNDKAVKLPPCRYYVKGCTMTQISAAKKICHRQERKESNG